MGKATSMAVTEFVREWIAEQRAVVPRVTFERIGEQLGCTHSHVIGILKGKSVGSDIEEAFAQLRFGGSVDAMRAAAKEWWREAEQRSWPNLHEAIAIRGEKWSPKTVDTLRKIGREWPVDRSVGSWIDDGDRIETGKSDVRERSDGLRALKALPPKSSK